MRDISLQVSRRSRLRLSFGLAISLGLASGCGPDDVAQSMGAIDAASMDAHLRFLAGDELEGRAPGTRGSELAANYIAAQFQLAGLTPGAQSGYLQHVGLVAARSDVRLTFRAKGGASFEPAAGGGFVAWTTAPAETLRVTGELVFVGYGIDALEYDWDDYKGADVSGKILLFLSNEPPAEAGFRSDTLTRYGLESYKFEQAVERGAAGAILVHMMGADGHKWEAVRGVRGGEVLSLETLRAPRPALQGWLSEETARQVIGMAGLDFPTLIELAGSRKFRPISAGVTLRATIVNRSRSIVDYNVAGLLPGSDPERADEVVVYTAHFDNLGIGLPVASDSIYNGAYDNASGTALLLTLAQAFGRLARRPERSILFLALTAAEPDLLGSAHYVREPLIPLAKTLAAINLDRANLWGPTEEVILQGHPDSRLSRIAEAAAEAEELRLEVAGRRGRGHANRSDDLNFSQAGVPAICICHGLDFLGRMPGWGRELVDGFEAEHYRQPSDEYRSELDLRGALQQGRVAFRIGLDLANAGGRPR